MEWRRSIAAIAVGAASAVALLALQLYLLSWYHDRIFGYVDWAVPPEWPHWIVPAVWVSAAAILVVGGLLAAIVAPNHRVAHGAVAGFLTGLMAYAVTTHVGPLWRRVGEAIGWADVAALAAALGGVAAAQLAKARARPTPES